jgi:hypothetical protein
MALGDNALERDIVTRFNDRWPVGTPVAYWTGDRQGQPKTGCTRTPAHLLGGHTPVVWISGQPSAIALTHVDPTEGTPS